MRENEGYIYKSYDLNWKFERLVRLRELRVIIIHVYLYNCLTF